MKRRGYSKEILEQIKPKFDECRKMWVIELAPGRFLHWLESGSNKPVTVDRPDFTMVAYNFKSEAEGIVKWLKQLWDAEKELPSFNPITVGIEIEELLSGRAE